MLEPLRQFICDECGSIIQDPEDGYVEWERIDDGATTVRGFRIVHHSRVSPLGGREGCYRYGNSPYRMDMHLNYFLEHVHQYMFTFLYPGQVHDPGLRVGCQVTDFVQFTDFFKRLTIPFYEEARRYFPAAIQDGFIQDDNEIGLYTPDRLRTIIEHYGE